MRTSFDEVFRRYRREAVLLHQPYPPHAGRRTNSKFGGLPHLPAHYDWPRTPNGTSLHFFAQIDCADVGFPTPLPGRGVLFFFGRDDEEQVWHPEDPAENCRVIYALDAFAGTAPREVPADLPPIGTQCAVVRRDSRLSREPGPNVHTEWPIQPLPIDTWPGVPPDEPDPRALSLAAYAGHLLGLKSGPQRVTWQEAEAQRGRYTEQHDQLRVNAFARATGQGPEGDLNQVEEAVRTIFFHADAGRDAYPQYWILIHYAARAVLRDPRIMGLWGSRLSPLVEQMVPIAEEWVRRSNAAGLDAPVSEEDRSAFRAWLMSVPSRHENLPPQFCARGRFALPGGDDPCLGRRTAPRRAPAAARLRSHARLLFRFYLWTRAFLPDARTCPFRAGAAASR